MAQLFGNGLLTFVNKKAQFNDFLPTNTFVSYQDIDDLSFKINKYKKDDKERKKIAKKGRDFYLRYINSTLVADFILFKTLDIKSKNSFVWER